MKPLNFEKGRKFQHFIEAFNIQTNHWVAHYVYKRLKFLNHKVASFVGTLIFLSTWHGFHSGYYATFTMEFLTVTMEKEVRWILNERLSTKLRNFFLTVWWRIWTQRSRLQFLQNSTRKSHLLCCWALVCFRVWWLESGPLCPVKGRQMVESLWSSQLYWFHFYSSSLW